MYEQAIAKLNGARRILLTSHVRPDGDAIGCLVGLREMLEAGQPGRTQVLLLSEPGDQYVFLLEKPYWVLGRDVTEEQVKAGRLEEFDAILVVDTSAVRQLPGIGDYIRQRHRGVVVIDHHKGNEPIGEVRVIDTGAGAAGELVYELGRRAGWQVNRVAAAAIFVAISTDTGWFRFENCAPRTLKIAGELVAAGAQPDELYHQLFQNFPPARAKLVAEALASLELFADDRLAVMQITNETMQRLGAKRSHIENIVNEPAQIGSVLVTILLVEEKDGNTRVSLRSRAVVDVNELAQRFGGGGHARAAGLTRSEPLPVVRALLIREITKMLE